MPTQSTDINGNPFGIAYVAINQTWNILKGVDVQGTSIGVYSDYANSTLENMGSIFGGVGVLFEAGGAASSYVVKNQKKGEIAGEIGVLIEEFAGSALVKNSGDIEGLAAGVMIDDFTGSAKVINKGKIQGGEYGVGFGGSSDAKVVNKGDIKGGTVGVYFDPDSPSAKGPILENHGTIKAFFYGVVIDGGAGGEAKVVNHKGAVIDGNLYALVSEDKLDLTNKGKIEGTVLTGEFGDKVINKGKINGDVALGEGNDIFKMKGDKAKAGMIDMGPGNDLVVLGKKADKLLFDSALNAATNVDTVKKFQSGKDKMYLDDDIFTNIAPGTLSSSAFRKGTEAQDADDRIIYDKKTGALYYDPDGVGGVAQVQFAKFDPGTKLKASDFTVGEYSINLIV